jgi:hypothetical protein
LATSQVSSAKCNCSCTTTWTLASRPSKAKPRTASPGWIPGSIPWKRSCPASSLAQSARRYEHGNSLTPRCARLGSCVRSSCLPTLSLAPAHEDIPGTRNPPRPRSAPFDPTPSGRVQMTNTWLFERAEGLILISGHSKMSCNAARTSSTMLTGTRSMRLPRRALMSRVRG